MRCHDVNGLLDHLGHLSGFYHGSCHAAGLAVHYWMVQVFPGAAQGFSFALLLLLFDWWRWYRDGLHDLPWSGWPTDGGRRVYVINLVQVVLGASPDFVVLISVVDADVIFLVAYCIDGHGGA